MVILIFFIDETVLAHGLILFQRKLSSANYFWWYIERSKGKAAKVSAFGDIKTSERGIKVHVRKNKTGFGRDFFVQRYKLKSHKKTSAEDTLNIICMAKNELLGVAIDSTDKSTRLSSLLCDPQLSYHYMKSYGFGLQRIQDLEIKLNEVSERNDCLELRNETLKNENGHFNEALLKTLC